MNPSLLQIASRVLASLVAGYGFCWGFVTLGIVLLLRRGVPYDEAQTALYLLAFIVYLIAVLWAFAAKSLVQVWAVLAGGGICMTALAWYASRTLV